MTDRSKFESLSERFGRRSSGRQTSITFRHVDDNALAYIKEQTGMSQGEAVRTALRVYAALLVEMNKRYM